MNSLARASSRQVDTVEALREALHFADPVAAIVLMKLIDDAVAVARRIEQLQSALSCRATPT